MKNIMMNFLCNNMKKRIHCLLVFISVFILAGCGEAFNSLNIPGRMEILRVEVRNNSGTISLEYENRDWIGDFVEELREARMTAKESVQDTPTNVEEYFQIDMITAEETNTLFCYSENRRYYIEQPYQGIFETDEDFIELLTEYDESVRR